MIPVIFINCKTAPYVDKIMLRLKPFETRSKWLYKLTDVKPVPAPVHPVDGIRHGRVWMEYNGRM